MTGSPQDRDGPHRHARLLHRCGWPPPSAFPSNNSLATAPSPSIEAPGRIVRSLYEVYTSYKITSTSAAGLAAAASSPGDAMSRTRWNQAAAGVWAVAAAAALTIS